MPELTVYYDSSAFVWRLREGLCVCEKPNVLYHSFSEGECTKCKKLFDATKAEFNKERLNMAKRKQCVSDPNHNQTKDPYHNRDLKDSGERQDFGTGAVRDVRTGKGRYDLLSAPAIFALARVFEEGAKKYKARNYEAGMPLCRFIDSALRHIFRHLEGYRDEPHMAQAAWNIMAYIHTATMIERGILPDSLNDLPNHLNQNKPTVL